LCGAPTIFLAQLGFRCDRMRIWLPVDRSASARPGTAAMIKVTLDEVPQRRVLADLARFGTRFAGVSSGLGGVGTVAAIAGVAVAADRPTDRGKRTAQFSGDR